MSGRDDRSKSSSEKSEEKFENIDANGGQVTPQQPQQQQQQPLQVGTSLEKSYSADELAEPMKAYPMTSERANEGQELTVRKRLMLTEKDESTADETAEPSQVAQEEQLRLEEEGGGARSANVVSTGPAEISMTSQDMSGQELSRSREQESGPAIVTQPEDTPAPTTGYYVSTGPTEDKEEASVSAVMVSQNEEQLRLDDGTGALSATNVSTGPTELSPSHDISAQDQDDAGSAASPSLAIINQGQLAVGEDAPSRSFNHVSTAPSAEQSQQQQQQSPSPSPAIVENKEGPNVGDVQDYSIFSTSRHDDTYLTSSQPQNPSVSGSDQQVRVTAVINEPEHTLDAEKSKSSFVDLTAEEAGGSLKVLDVPNSQQQQSNATAPPTEKSQRPSDLSQEEVPAGLPGTSEEPAGTVEQEEDDDERLRAEELKLYDRGLSKEGTHGSSAVRPYDDSEIHDMFIIDSGTGGAVGGGNRSAAVQTSAPGGAGTGGGGGGPVHPVENSRQKWKLQGGEEGEVALEDQERAGAAAIAPMRLSMTNESELTIGSSNDITLSGNDDTKLGIPPQTRTAVQEQPPDDSLANPADVEAEQPKNTLSLRAPSKSPSAYANMNSDIVSGPEDRSAAVEAVEDQSQGRTFNMDDGTSVDENASGPRPEYVCNIEDSRPPWMLEAHTTLPNSKTQKTPRVVKSYDEEVSVGQQPPPVPSFKDVVVPEVVEAEVAATEAAEAEGTISRSQMSDIEQSTPQPKLFNRNLQEMSEMMNSVDCSKSSEKMDTLSADIYTQSEEVDAEEQNLKTITPGPIPSEPDERTKNLEAEHSLARSSPGSQPEQYANRRIVAKPLEGTCESCDFVASDMGSSRQSVSSRGSKKYSYAKSFSEASMTATYATDDRVPSPQEQGEVDAPELEYPSTAESNVDVITNEYTNTASETVPAEKEGDMDFYPSRSSAAPSTYNRSMDDRDPNDFKEIHPTQRQFTLQSIDDEESSEEEAGIVQLDDSRNALWTIQPKPHKRKSSAANPQEQTQGQFDEDPDQFEYEPDDGQGGPKRRKISKPDSGIASNRGRSFVGQQRRQVGAGGGARGGGGGTGRAHGTGGMPPSSQNSKGKPSLETCDEAYEVEQEPVRPDAEQSNSIVGSENTDATKSAATEGSDYHEGTRSVVGSEDVGSDRLIGASILEDENYVDTSLKRDSHDSLNFGLTPINEEQTTSQNLAEVSAGNSFHSCDENGQFLQADKPDRATPSPVDASDHFESPQISFKRQETEVQYQISSKSTSVISTEDPIEPVYQKLVASEAFQFSELEKQEQFGQGQGPIQTCNLAALSASDGSAERPMDSFMGPLAGAQNRLASGSLHVVHTEDFAMTQVHAVTQEAVFKARDSFDASTLSGKAILTTFQNIQGAVRTEINQTLEQQRSIGQSNPDLVQQYSQDSMIYDTKDDSTGVHTLDEAEVEQAEVSGVGSEEADPSHRFSVEDPKASTKDKCIIMRQKIPPVDANEDIEEMSSPHFGPSAEPSILTHNLDGSSEGLMEPNNVNVDSIGDSAKDMLNPNSFTVNTSCDLSSNQNASMESLAQMQARDTLHTQTPPGMRARKQLPAKVNYDRPEFVVDVPAVSSQGEYDDQQPAEQYNSGLPSETTDSPYPDDRVPDDLGAPVDFYSQPLHAGEGYPCHYGGLDTPVNRPSTLMSSHMSGAGCVLTDEHFPTDNNRQYGEATPVPGPVTPVGYHHQHPHPVAPPRAGPPFVGRTAAAAAAPPLRSTMVNSSDPNYSIYIYDDPSRSMERRAGGGGSGHHFSYFPSPPKSALHRSSQSLLDGTGNQDTNRSGSSEGGRVRHRKSTQSLSDGVSSVSQSVRGSNFVIDMRPDSTHSLNMGLYLEKSMNGEKETTLSVPATPNMISMPSNTSVRRLRSTTFKPLTSSSSNPGLRMSARNLVATPMTVDMDLASPREPSRRTVVSSQSLERQIRVTRVRSTTKLRAGDEVRRLLRRGSAGGRSPHLGGKHKHLSPGAAGAKGTQTKEITHTQVAAGGEQQNRRNLLGKETKSAENEIVAQAGHAYITTRDLPNLRQH